MKVDGKNKHKSKIGDWHNRTGFGGDGERGGNSEKLEKRGICNLRTGDQILMKFDV